MGSEQIRKKRVEKIKHLRGEGFVPYPITTRRTHKITEIIEKFFSLQRLKKEIFLVGRIKSIRTHGKITFFTFEDGTGAFQGVLKSDKVGEKKYEVFLNDFDIGDFINVRGYLFKTKKGEKSIDITDLKMLSKALLPLPEKWHGLKDIEERYRKRYLDLIFNPEVKRKFKIRSKIIKEIMNFLEKEGFLEVETPVLQPIYGGATARPFKTHLNALNIDLYLRISPELYLKRLLVGGFEKVYEIGKCFRNEGIDRAHNPEFTMLEAYWAYADYKDLMKLTEKMFSVLIKKLFGKLEIKYEGKKINFKTPWPRVEFNQLFRKYTKINLDEINLEALKEKAEKLGIECKGGKFEIADEIYKKVCRPKIIQPTFLIHYPAESFPLSKPLDKNPKKSASFQLVAVGMELVKAFSELNDPIKQRERFEEQEKLYKKGFDEAQRIDKDFLESLEYGMPPAAGLGLGVDRVVALLTDSHTIREIIFFPLMRPK